MDVKRALLIADPGTREQALGEYARNCHLRSASLEVACEVLGAAYKRTSAERSAAAQNRCEVTEVCPHCGSEITMIWDVAQAGYKAFCPVCGERLMLCDMCLHPEGGGGNCDYDSKTDTCKHNGGAV